MKNLHRKHKKTTQKSDIAGRDNRSLTAYLAPNSVDTSAISALLSNPGSLTAQASAQKLDRDWFRTHPGRSHRVRRAFPGEMPGDLSDHDYIVVRQLQPGFRLRAGFSAPIPLPEEDPPEAVAHAIFDLTQERPGQFVSAAELYRRIYAYSLGGGRSGGEGGTVH